MTNIIETSRPRFWIYLFGPYLIGLIAAASSPADLLGIDSILFGLFFLLPANLLVYGVNDIFDYETDLLNPKKTGYEAILPPAKRRTLWLWIVLMNLPSIVAASIITPESLPWLLIFCALSIFYSAPPIRAKEIPFLDSIFNVLYLMPGAFSYQMLAHESPSLLVILTGFFWTAAMHAFSAIPDIQSDRDAGMQTIATKLGSRGTHVFCAMCYLISLILAGLFAPQLIIVGVFYVALMLYSASTKNPSGVFGIYRWFPIINAIFGFCLFWYIAWKKFF